jgi:hypothetical protein
MECLNKHGRDIKNNERLFFARANTIIRGCEDITIISTSAQYCSGIGMPRRVEPSQRSGQG